LAVEVERQVTSGLRSPGDLTEARAQVAERKASLTAAMQDRDEQLAAIQIFFAAIDGAAARTFVPAEGLSAAGGEAFALDSLDAIMARRSEVAVQALEIEKTEVQTLLAEDATRAQLNLNLEASKNRLEADYVPFRQLFGANNPYQSWRVGFEYRRGLNGGQKAKADLKSALLREKQAELTMSALRQRLAAEVNSTGSILIQAKRALAEQSQLVDQKRKMVAEETAREQAGLSTAVERITREIELCLALEAAADALAQLQMANNLSAHVAGKLLSAYDIK
jgi:outer membrane protein TolC